MKVVKYSGLLVDFDPKKLEYSLLKSGASSSVVASVLQKINNEIFDGITTKQIYKMAFGLLKKQNNFSATRYNLRDSIQLLGPAGFYFEKYVSRIFEYEGYEVKTNLILQGHCVTHEVDILIRKNNSISMVECKFHSGREASSDVKIPLYILSRFNDLKDIKQCIFSANDVVSKCWIVTNNRFTADAIEFAECSGLNLLSWDFPKNNNLKTKNDVNHLYPSTCLTTLTLAEKEKLLFLDVILVKEINNLPDCLVQIGLSSDRMKNVLNEVRELCG
jgi:hypothetical protein